MAGETHNFQIGEVVQLNTGGPEMSVEDIQGNICICRWFINRQDKSGSFVDRCLVPVSKKSPVIHSNRRGVAVNQS